MFLRGILGALFNPNRKFCFTGSSATAKFLPRECDWCRFCTPPGLACLVPPALLESVYLACLVFELGRLGFKLQAQSPIPVVYKGVRLDCGFRADLIVEDAVIVEIEAVDRIAPIHQAQMLTYLRLSGYALGLIINFNTKLLTDGVKRVVNGFPDPAGDMRPRRTESTQSPRRTQRTY